jgi:hypothetical protein
MDEMPGWELTQTWMADEGMPDRGLLGLIYFSGNGSRQKECCPVVPQRKALLHLTLIEEEQMLEDIHKYADASAKSGVGLRHINNYSTSWTTFLITKDISNSLKE